MTEQIKEQMVKLHEQGKGYKAIAKELDLNVGSVSIFFKRLREKANATYCLYCHKKLKQTKGHRQKKFCDDKCRYFWNKRNPQTDGAFYKGKCECCGAEFVSYGNSKRRYCSRECYLRVHRKKL